MTVGSGRTLLQCSLPSGPLGRCLRILLESKTWGSTEFLLTWSGKATPRGRSVFLLVPSMPPTDGCGTGLSADGWPTCRAGKTTAEELETCQKRADDGKVSTPPLGLLVKHLAVHPTPRAENSEQTGAHRGVADTLTSSTRQLGVWPTLHGMDNEGNPRRNGPTGNELGRACNSALVPWPTLTARDDKGQTQNPDRMDYVPNIVRANGTGSCGCLARTGSFVGRLMTLSTWLMGYTAAYLRHWETASCRKSLRKSSAQSVRRRKAGLEGPRMDANRRSV